MQQAVVRVQSPDIPVFWSSIPPQTGDSKMASRVNEFNETLRYFALTNSNCHFLNSFHHLSDLGTSAFQNLSYSKFPAKPLSRLGAEALHKRWWNEVGGLQLSVVDSLYTGSSVWCLDAEAPSVDVQLNAASTTNGAQDQVALGAQKQSGGGSSVHADVVSYKPISIVSGKLQVQRGNWKGKVAMVHQAPGTASKGLGQKRKAGMAAPGARSRSFSPVAQRLPAVRLQPGPKPMAQSLQAVGPPLSAPPVQQVFRAPPHWSGPQSLAMGPLYPPPSLAPLPPTSMFAFSSGPPPIPPPGPPPIPPPGPLPPAFLFPYIPATGPGAAVRPRNSGMMGLLAATPGRSF